MMLCDDRYEVRQDRDGRRIYIDVYTGQMYYGEREFLRKLWRHLNIATSTRLRDLPGRPNDELLSLPICNPKR